MITFENFSNFCKVKGWYAGQGFYYNAKNEIFVIYENDKGLDGIFSCKLENAYKILCNFNARKGVKHGL